LEFSVERRRREGTIERLWTQHTEAVRDKSAVENKSRNLLEKLTAAETEKEDLSHRLAEEREGAEKAHAKAQAARAEADAARAEASLALKRAADVESELKSLHSYTEKTEASTRAGVERAHTMFVDVYREPSARTAPFDRSGEEAGLRFLGGCRRSWSHSCLSRWASCPTPRLLPTRGLRMPCPVKGVGISKSSTG
jgi:seryl-tRNA synthetase